MNKVKVLVVDDSAVVRQVLTTVLRTDPALEVVGAAVDPIAATEHLRRCWPDVIVLDVEMPRMDGLSFLRKVMAERPTPVVICSSLTQAGAPTSLEALAAGAVAVYPKPQIGLRQFLEGAAAELIATVKAAATANVRRRPRATPAPPVEERHTADVILPFDPERALSETTERVVAIGASTGGTQALERVLSALPRVCPAIVVVQHMPESFTSAFAARLHSCCRIEVVEAKRGDRVTPGKALIAPGGKHLLLRRSGAQYVADVVDGPPVSRHRPSVDVLFRSVAQAAGRNALGIIMTGMGDDGATGLLEMKRAGAATVAQDEASCVVYGMPKEAVRRGAVDRSLDLDELPAVILADHR